VSSNAWLSEAVRFLGFPWDKAKEFYPTDLSKHLTLHDANLHYPFFVEPPSAIGTLIVDLDWLWHKHLTPGNAKPEIMVFGFNEVRTVQYQYDLLVSDVDYRGIGGATITERSHGFCTEIEMMACPDIQIEHDGSIQVLAFGSAGQLVDLPWVEFPDDRQN